MKRFRPKRPSRPLRRMPYTEMFQTLAERKRWQCPPFRPDDSRLAGLFVNRIQGVNIFPARFEPHIQTWRYE